MPPKVISQAAFFYKLHWFLIYLLFSADEHSLLLYVGEGILLILIFVNALVGGTLFDFQNFTWNLLLEMWWKKLPRDKAVWYREQLNIIFVGFLVSYQALQFLSRRKHLKTPAAYRNYSISINRQLVRSTILRNTYSGGPWALNSKCQSWKTEIYLCFLIL